MIPRAPLAGDDSRIRVFERSELASLAQKDFSSDDAPVQELAFRMARSDWLM